MSINGFFSFQSDNDESQEINSSNEECSDNFNIFAQELNESLKQIPQRIDASNNLIEPEQSNLKLLSMATPLFSEELLINEPIDYLMNDSAVEVISYETSKNITFNYTKSDQNTPFSFQNLTFSN